MSLDAIKGSLKVWNLMARVFLIASVLVLSETLVASAQTSATPAPSPAKPLKLTGNVRAFYFTRSNVVTCDSVPHHGAPGATAGSSGDACNAAAFNFGGKLHADYQLGKTPWSLGASLFAADPLASNGNLPGFNARIDNSLPGYAINVLGEGYLQYKNKGATAQIGREIINTPWANASDSRITPASFQGASILANVAPKWKLGAYYMGRFRSRTTSAFSNSTLLTSCDQLSPVQYFDPATGAAKTPIAGGDPCTLNPAVNTVTKGFAMVQVSDQINPTWTANLYQYQVYDIVNITHAETKYNFAPKSSTNPFLAVQYIAESDTGRALVGAIKAHMFGFQYGESIGKNIDFAGSLNQSYQTAYVTTNCTSTPGGVFGGVASSKAAFPGAPVLCYGGGIASPYTDSYATDPLFTTSISQGMADVHKPGTGIKAALTIQTNNKRLKGVFSGAQYYYELPAASVSIANAVDMRKELDIDIQYFFSPLDAKKPYHGLSIRHRYADRSTYFGRGATATSSPDFKYNRTQLEWTF
ncbi:MAG: OprD family outer membrane porin [Candidatus Baltobacteraceae bacterium]